MTCPKMKNHEDTGREDNITRKTSDLSASINKYWMNGSFYFC